MFGLVVRFEILDSTVAARFDVLTEEVVGQVSTNEPGTLVYATHGVVGEPLVRIFYEMYADEDAYRTHNEAVYVKAFHARKAPLLVGQPRVEFLDSGRAVGLPAA